MRGVACCLLLATGCLVDEPIAPISDFTLLTYVGDGATIELQHDGVRKSECLVLEENATASIAGVPLGIETRGGWVDSSDIDGYCQLPETLESTLLVGPHECPLGDTLVPFTVELVRSGPWVFPPGETFTVRADKPADTARLSAHIRQSPTGIPVQIGVATSGDTLEVTIPTYFDPADYELVVLAHHATQADCAGRLFTSHLARQPLTVRSFKML
jgi:hypothetical protein